MNHPTASRPAGVPLEAHTCDPAYETSAGRVSLWLTLAMVFILPWEAIITISEFGTITRLVGLLVATSWGVVYLTKMRVRRPDSFHVFFFLFSLWNTCSIFWSVSVDATIQQTKTCFQLGCMLWIIWDLTRCINTLRSIMQAYVFGACVAAGSTVINFINGVDIQGRFSGAELNANHLAMILSLAIPLAWHLATIKTTRSPRRLFAAVNFAYIPIAIFSILLTGSRMGLLSLVPPVILMLTTFSHLTFPSRITILCVLLGALAALLPQIPSTITERLGTARASIEMGDLGGRVEIWREGIAGFAKHPILGVGAGAFVSVAHRTRGVAHNTFLSVLTELGIIGFLIFLFLLARTAFCAVVQPKDLRRLWFTVLLIWGISAFALTSENMKPPWLFFALVVAGAGLTSRKTQTSSVYETVPPSAALRTVSPTHHPF